MHVGSALKRFARAVLVVDYIGSKKIQNMS